MAASVLLRLAILTGEDRYRAKAEEVLASVRDMMVKMPSGFGYVLSALDFYLSKPKEIVVVGDLADERTQTLLAKIRSTYLPNAVVVHKSPDDTETGNLIPLLQGRTLVDGQPAVYVCEQMTCQLPVTTVEALARQL